MSARPILIAESSFDAADYIWYRLVPSDALVVTPTNCESALRGMRSIGTVYTTEASRQAREFDLMVREVNLIRANTGSASALVHLKAV